MKEYYTKPFAEAIGCSYRTVQDWRISHHGRPPQLMPVRYEGRKAIYTEEQIPLALALLAKKKSLDADVSVSLFGGSEDTDVPKTFAKTSIDETDGTEEDSDDNEMLALVPAEDSDDDDELIDPPTDSDDFQPARADDTGVPTADAPPANDDHEVDSADLQSVANSSEVPAAPLDTQNEQATINQPLADDAPAVDNVADVPKAIKADTPKDFLPMTTKPNFDAIPQAMKDLRRWLCWQLRFKSKPKKPNEKTKIPMTPKNGRLTFADVTNPENWLTFDEAISYYKRGLCSGIGFALTNKAPKLCCVDVDHCFNEDGTLNDEAKAVIELCGNSWVEISQSGDGIHIWFIDEEFPGERGRKRGGVEVYAFDRYIAITGVYVETSSKELLTVNGACRNVIAKFIDTDVDKASLFDKPARATEDKDAIKFTVDTNAPLSDDDRRLIEYLRSDKCKAHDTNIFNLFSGNVAEYFKNKGKPVDDSVADCDLLIKLLYYVGGTGTDVEIGQRALKVFGQSELAKRGKWLDREDYRLRTLDFAFGVWIKGGRKTGKSETTNTPVQIEQLKADLREVAQKLADFDAQRDAALERLKNVETFDSDTVLSDDVIEAAAFAKNYDIQALATFKRAVKNYGKQHKDNVVNANDFRDCVKEKAEELEARRHGLEARSIDLQAQINSLSFLADNEEMSGVKIPYGYEVAKNGIQLVAGEKLIPVARLPVIIKSKSFAIDDEDFKLTLSYKDENGKWRRLPAQEAATVSDKNKIVALSNKGLPVTSSTAKLLIDYLDAFRKENEIKLPLTYTVPRCGWHEFNGTEYFIDPRRSTVVTEDNKQISVVADSSSQFAKALRSKGTLAQWKRAYELAKKSPVARIIVAASVAAPLLKVLGERNFLLYVYAPTRAGKTTALCLGGSAVGSEKMIRSFDSTRNGLNGAAADVCDFPFIVDEKQVADTRLKEQLDNLVYSLANGVGRTKLNKDSTLKDLQMWRTIAIMTGETRMLADNVTGGANTRLLTIAAPKIILSPEDCKTIRDIIAENHGHALPLVVDKIIATGKTKLRSSFQKNVEVFTETVSSGKLPKVLPEYCRYMAVLTLADALLNSYSSNVDANEVYDDAIANATKIFPLIPTMEEMSDTAREQAFVLGFCAQNQNRFVGGAVPLDRMQTVFGKLNDDDGFNYIIAKVLRDACQTAGFDYHKLVADLIAADFFVPSDKIKKGRKKPLNTVQKKIGTENTDCYRFKRKTIADEEE